MARALWRGAIQFGLVTIPVKLYLATESKGISFNMLHDSCLTRIQMKTYCPTHDEVISRADTVRGYEYAKGEYVVVSDEDLTSVPLKTVRSIEIEQFIRSDEDGQALRFGKQAYYLEPEPIGRKAFYLLKAVLGEQGLTAIAKLVLKDREQLVAIDPFASTLLLTTLYWPDEIRSTEELALPEGEVEIKPAERKMAEQLISAMTGAFEPAAFHDDYREALMGVIEAKVAGQEIVQPEPAPAGKLVDLMAALEASVAAAREKRLAATEAPESLEAARAASRPATRRKPASRARDEAEAADEAAPVRRRKSA
ncbi:MAG: non-homologous end joining protein Ku [Candidatus Limnocylindrales bacterium]